MGAFLIATQAAATVGGALLQSKGAIDEANAAASAAEYNRQLTLREGRMEEARRRRVARRELSSQRVAIAKSGLQLEGSPLERLAENAAELERDSIQPRVAAEASADLDRRRIRAIRRTGQIGAQASIISGIGRVSGIASQTLGGGKRSRGR